MSTKTETVSVWLTQWQAEEGCRAEQLPLHALATDRLNSTMETQGWVKVGTAEMTVTYLPADDIREKAADAIRAQMADAAAKYQAMQTELQERLNKLLAIGCEVEQ